MNPKKEVKKKLDDLYYKNEEIKKDLITLHNLLKESNFFVDAPQNTPPVQQQYHPPVQQPYIPPQPILQPQVVVPPVVQQPQRIMEERKPVPQMQQQAFQQQYIPPVPPPTKVPEKSFFERHPDMEKLIGERLLTFIGVIILVIGIAFFVKFAIDQEWINETGRTAIGILCGGIILGFAHRLRKNFEGFSSVLVGGGIAVLYFTISYAFQVYHLFPQSAAFGILIVITGFTILLSLSYNRKELAIFAIVGGFCSPLMVSNGNGNLPVLSTYMLILDIGMLVLAYYKKWNIINILSYLFTIFLFAGALTKEVYHSDHPQYVTGLIFATLFYLTFFGMNIVNNVRLKAKFTAFEILSLLSNTFLYFGCGYFILNQMDAKMYQGLFTLLVAAFNCVFAFLLLRRQEVDRNLFYFLVGLVITFISLAGPVQLNGNHITLFWAAEATLLFWLYQRSKIDIIRFFSVILTFIGVLGLLYNWTTVYFDLPLSKPIMDVLINKGFITGIVLVISLMATSFLAKKETDQNVIPGWSIIKYRQFLNVMAVVLLYLTGFLEMQYHLSVLHSSDNELAIYAATYSGLFALALYVLSRPLKLNYLSVPFGIIGVGMMILYGFLPHISTIDARNHFLLNNGDGKNAFMFHYIYVAVIIAFTVLIYRFLNKDDKYEKGIKDGYLWIMCFILVFIASAELDHTYIISSFHPVGAFDNARGIGADAISVAASESHKIGFPILWGLSSFLMIVIGMRKKIRMLRVIALVLFAVTIIKLILLGVYGESQTGKIIAFIISGVILLLVSFLYQKLKKLVLENDHPTENKIEDEKVS